MVPHDELLRLSSLCYSTSTFEIDGIEVLVSQWDKYSVVAIRGTQMSWRDIFRDARATPYKSELLGWGHKGFLVAAEKVLQRLSIMSSIKGPYVFTGHSLGGAIALAASYGAWKRGWDVRQMVGFGTPKVFYRESKKLPLEDIAYTLYENGTDPVVRVPMFFGERIVKPQKIGKKKGIRKLIPCVNDHLLSSYEESLSKEPP